MKIVIAPDSYKESLTAMQVADAMEAGFRHVFPDAEYLKLPMADGGEGTVQSLVDASGGEIIHCEVTGPLGNKVEAFYGLMGEGETAVIEMAAASGIHLVTPEQRNPLITTTFGTGELIKAALDRGVKHIIVGIGGSATNDGGIGMAQALGVSFTDADGNALGHGGGELGRLAKIDMSQIDPRLASVRLEVACDVDNPLCGDKGASAVFGPQKGATPDMVATLDANLAHYAEVINAQLERDIANSPGAGAAGGLGAALLGLLDASLRPGIDIVMDAVALDKQVQGADLVLTGEGRMDSQTVHGKTPIGVARTAKQHQIPVVGIAGSITPDSHIVHDHGIDAVFSVVPSAMDLPHALAHAAEFVEQTAHNVAQLWKVRG
ncbi:glycerate kinase [Thaumasiovibrio subtropicus]|uniref:glycerate kinase n=1 Tax=Thaumasiovibrio subtropicus TaxID=1891207 RepID=UPI000B34E1A2|nr:glycerate kinase [Thaumasiovibrio subtropicus]